MIDNEEALSAASGLLDPFERPTREECPMIPRTTQPDQHRQAAGGSMTHVRRPVLFRTAEGVAALIGDGATVGIGSGGGILEPGAVLAAVETRFLATGSTRNLTVIHGLGIGEADCEHC
jgi:hypothetical protein